MLLGVATAAAVASASAASVGAGTTASVGHRMPRMRHSQSGSFLQQPGRKPSTLDCDWRFYTQPLSHFSEGSTIAGNASFTQRVCIIDKFWKPPAAELFPHRQHAAAAKKGPILFYTGNESPIDEYVNNTGLMWALAPKLGALLVFAEHRYEGLSFPGVVGVPNCLSHCTSAEALADYAALVVKVKADLGAGSSPVVAFGGSYGGMLAAWLRMKYPNVVDGAIAASAPIWSFPSSRPPLDGFGRTITRGVSAAGGATDTCRDNLIAVFPLINEAGKSAAGRAVLSDAFQTCKPLQVSLRQPTDTAAADAAAGPPPPAPATPTFGVECHPNRVHGDGAVQHACALGCPRPRARPRTRPPRHACDTGRPRPPTPSAPHRVSRMSRLCCARHKSRGCTWLRATTPSLARTSRSRWARAQHRCRHG